VASFINFVPSLKGRSNREFMKINYSVQLYMLQNSNYTTTNLIVLKLVIG